MILTEAPCDLGDIIEDLRKEVGIPDCFGEQAQREGQIAFHESRDIGRALLYWWETLQA